MNNDVKLSLIWGAVVVLVIGLIVTLAIITTAPRGNHGRLACDVTDNNSYTVTITCATGPKS